MTLQQQIKNLAMQLEELAQQVAQPEMQHDAELDKLLIQAKNNPFEQHVVAAHDDYVKGLYIQALLSIVQQSEAAKMERYGLVARIYYAFPLSESFEQYVTKSQLLSLRDFEQFFTVIKEHACTEVFLLDALFILGIQPEKRISEYVTELVANLSVSQQDFMRACQLVKAILCVDEEAIEALFSVSKLYQKSAAHLLKAIDSKCMPVICIEGNGETVVQLDDFVTQTLIIKNAVIKISNYDIIENLEVLEFVNCKLELVNGKDKNPFLMIQDVGSVLLKDIYLTENSNSFT